MREQEQYKRSKIQLTKEALRRCVERNFPIDKLKRMVLGGKWCSHIEENKRMCVYKNGIDYWTIIIVPTKSYIFIVTVYQSNHGEKRMFKSFEEGWCSRG